MDLKRKLNEEENNNVSEKILKNSHSEQTTSSTVLTSLASNEIATRTTLTEDRIGVVYALCQLIQGSIFLKVLTLKETLPLTLISKNLSKLIRSYIEQNYSFIIKNDPEFSFIFYKPICVAIPSVDHIHNIILKYPTITQLKFNHFGTHSRTLPSCINRIFFGWHFNEKVQNLPDSITHIRLGFMFNSPDFTFPPNITHIEFSDCFDRSVDFLLPQKVQKIKFGNAYNKSVDHLPYSITTLIFGNMFKKPFNKPPPNLKSLEFGLLFNNSLEALPNKLTHLKFFGCFNNTILLPESLKIVRFGFRFDQILDALPSHLEVLILGEDFHRFSTLKLPFSLKLLLIEKNSLMSYVRKPDVDLPIGCKSYCVFRSALYSFSDDCSYHSDCLIAEECDSDDE